MKVSCNDNVEVATKCDEIQIFKKKTYFVCRIIKVILCFIELQMYSSLFRLNAFPYNILKYFKVIYDQHRKARHFKGFL